MDYSKGKIYLIECIITNQKYIGSSTQTLKQRIIQHKSDAKRKKCKLYSHMNEYNFENFVFTIIEEWPCKNKFELLLREGYHQVINNVVINGLNNRYAKLPAFTQHKIHNIQSYEWFLKNKEKRKSISNEKAKKYRNENPDKCKEARTKYNTKNREKINAKARAKHQQLYNNEPKIITVNTEKRELMLKQRKESHIKNKEKEKEKRKEKVNCPNCNREILKISLTRHLKEACKK